jgi:glycosyltransferase involved in cell wall biosynthesis
MQRDMRTAWTTAPTEHPAPPTQTSASLRVAFVNTHPIQYFAPLYAHMTRNGIEITALYLSDFSIRGGHDKGFGQAVRWDIDLLEGYRSEFMGHAAKRREIGGFFSMIAPELWSAIRRGAFDAVVIHGHSLAAHHVALAAARASGTPVLTRGETHLRLARANWRNAVRTPILKTWYRAFDGVLAIGTANARYYAAMGVSSDCIFQMPYTVDNARFMAACDSARAPALRAETRQRLGISGPGPAILYAAKFDPRKRPGDLLAAFAVLQRQGVDAHLVLVGSGALESELRSRVTTGRIRNVIFPGFVNQSGLPAVYAACDVFVLPSENEPWGLAVNEAMCAGLPIVLSEEIGCAEDLVRDGVNGATFRAGDVDGLAKALRSFLVDAHHAATAGAASRARIAEWSYAECTNGLRHAVETIRQRRRLERD